jgi:hypothetical protein
LLRRLFERLLHHDDVAAIVIDPFLGSGSIPCNIGRVWGRRVELDSLCVDVVILR